MDAFVVIIGIAVGIVILHPKNWLRVAVAILPRAKRVRFMREIIRALPSDNPFLAWQLGRWCDQVAREFKIDVWADNV